MIPTSSDLSISTKSGLKGDVDAVVAFATEGNAETAIQSLVAAGAVNEAGAKSLSRLAGSGAFRGKSQETVYDVFEPRAGKYQRIYLIGLGKADKVNDESLRQAAAKALKALRKHKLSKSAVLVPALSGKAPSAVVEAIATGALLASFKYEEYKGAGQKKDDDSKNSKLEWTLVTSDGSARAALERARAICDGQNFARTIASRPGNNINPPSLVGIATAMAREAGLKCRVLDDKELKKLGMGGILAVGAGSIATPPRIIVLEHGAASGKKAKAKPILVVGKTITFDTGGISIKPAEKMGKMIFDKCGGMAVLGLMYALAKLKTPAHVVGILSCAENAVSSQAYRPGDILRMYNGVTVDVTNTDAEGRLVLGDALAWGIETYKPSTVVDLATLTGGVITALGKTMAGVMANHDGIVADLNAAAERAGEKIWRLPLGEDQRDYIRGDAADIVNSAGREGHPLQGGAFLSFFVPADLPWAHLDIAGVADTEKELPYYAKGATGWGVRTLINWIEASGK